MRSLRARHAHHFKDLTPRAELVAASTPDKKETSWGRQNLENVKFYEAYDDMLNHEGLQAVVIASATAVHAEQAIKAINKGLHVLCEKPLSTSIEVVCMSPDSFSAIFLTHYSPNQSSPRTRLPSETTRNRR